MEASEEVLLRIAKLLALSHSSNEYEAASAAAKAQDLMFRYGVSVSQVEGVAGTKTDTIKSHVMRKVFEGKVRTTWRERLFGVVGRTSMCFSYVDIDVYSHPYGIYVGAEADVKVADYVFTYLMRELERQAERYIRKQKLRGGAAVSGRYSWLNGATTAVAERLNKAFEDRKKESGEIGTAIVVAKGAEIDRHLRSAGLKFKTKKLRIRPRARGYLDGFDHGSNMDLGNPGLSYEEAVKEQPRRILP